MVFSAYAGNPFAAGRVFNADSLRRKTGLIAF